MLHSEGPAGTSVYDHGVREAGKDLDELRHLTIDAGWWPLFDHPEPNPWDLGRSLSVEAARTRYARP